jgi:hypothetical protein
MALKFNHSSILMNKPTYNVKASEDGLSYYFESINDERKIQKIIAYLPTENNADLFQLIFGDLTSEGMIDVLTVSNNQDRDIVLITVVSSLAKFFENYPDKTVVFSGSTESRTRLYRATIAKFIETTELYYQVFGIFDDDTAELFNKNHSYYAYLIQKKDDN